MIINITKEAKKEVALQEDLMENTRTKSLSLLANLKESFEKMEEYRVRSEGLAVNNSVLKEDNSEFLNNMHDYYKKAVAKEEKTVTSLIEELQKIYNWQDKGNNLVSSNWSDIFNTMSNEQIGAFSNLLFCSSRSNRNICRYYNTFYLENLILLPIFFALASLFIF